MVVSQIYLALIPHVQKYLLHPHLFWRKYILLSFQFGDIVIHCRHFFSNLSKVFSALKKVIGRARILFSSSNWRVPLKLSRVLGLWAHFLENLAEKSKSRNTGQQVEWHWTQWMGAERLRLTVDSASSADAPKPDETRGLGYWPCPVLRGYLFLGTSLGAPSTWLMTHLAIRSAKMSPKDFPKSKVSKARIFKGLYVSKTLCLSLYRIRYT